MRNYAQIRNIDISDGPGIRCSIYTQGCSHHCKNCFNPETWNYEGGKQWTEKTNKEILTLMKDPHTDGFSVLGGDPFDYYLTEYYEREEDTDLLADLLSSIKKETPEKSIWLWTGFVWENFYLTKEKEDLYNYVLGNRIFHLLKYIDVIVDGPFKEEEKDFNLPYCGSRNQRVIDVKKTIESDTIVLWS